MIDISTKTVSLSSSRICLPQPHPALTGEALYRFLLSHSQTPPTVFIHLHGSHTESRTRLVTRRDSNGNYRTEDEHYTEEVTGGCRRLVLELLAVLLMIILRLRLFY